jgi:AraC-like DNA-binding protein
MDFLRATGSTIKDEINRVRFERVELLLRVPSQRLGAIAHLCGWQTENALRAAFLKRYGVSMRAWRNTHLTPRARS